MALISCPECKHQVSSNAPTCPSCGHPISGQTVSKTHVAGKAVTAIGAWLLGEWVVKAIFVIVFGVVAVVLFSRN